MKHAALLSATIVAVVAGARLAPAAEDPATIAEAIQQAIAAKCAEIGVTADGAKVVDPVRAVEADVDALAQRMREVQQEAADEYRKEQQRLDSPDFQGLVRELAMVRDRFVDAIEEKIEQRVEHARKELEAAEQRVKELEGELLAARNDFDGAMELQLASIRSHGQAVGGAYSGMQQAMSRLDGLVQRKASLEAKESSMVQFIFGTRNTAELELIKSDVDQVARTVSSTISTVNAALDDYGRDRIPTLDPSAASDPNALRQAARSVFDSVSGLVQRYEELLAKESAVESKKAELESARADVRRLRQTLDEAIDNEEPPASLLQGLRETQAELEAMFEPHDEARDIFRAVRAVARGVRDCIETARADGGAGDPTIGQAAHCTGTWRWDCEGFDMDGKRYVDADTGRFRLDVTPVPLVEGATPPDVAEVVGRFSDDQWAGESITAKGTLTRRAGDLWTVSIIATGASDGTSTHMEFTGALKGDPFRPGTLTAPSAGKVLRRDRGNERLDCTGSWSTGS